MLKLAEVYIVRPFPEIQVCQLPNINIHVNYFTEIIGKKSINCLFTGSLTKQIIEEAFMMHGYHKLIVCKIFFDHQLEIEDGAIWTSYCLLNMDMTELLDIANQSRKFQELKAFW